MSDNCSAECNTARRLRPLRPRMRTVLLVPLTALLTVATMLAWTAVAPAASLPTAAAADYAPGSMSLNRTTTTVAAKASYGFRYSAGSTSRVRGTLLIAVPGTWTAPQSASSSRAGYTTVSRGSCAKAKLVRVERLTSNERRLVVAVDCKRAKAFTIAYRNATAPTRAGTYTWPATAKFNQWGTYVPVRTTPQVVVKPGPAARLMSPFARGIDSKTPLAADVVVADKYGNAPAAAPATVTATVTGCPNASLTGVQTVASGANGIAYFTNLTLNRACSAARLTYTAPGLQSAITPDFRVAGSWEAIASNDAPLDYASSTLPDGRVLFLGAATRIFNPATSTFSLGATSPAPRTNARAVTMANGSVMVVTGQSGSSQTTTQVHVYDPQADKWSRAADRPEEAVTDTFNDHLLLLDDGRILDVPQSHDRTITPMLYNPNSDAWTTAPTIKQSNRQGHTVLKLADGRVLLTGGDTRDALLIDETEIFDPATATWTQAASSPVGTAWAAGVALRNGKAMLVGTLATGGREASRTVQTYDPVTNTWVQGAQLDTTRYTHSAIQRADGHVMAAGGSTYVNYPKGETTTTSLDPSGNAASWSPEGPLVSPTDYRPLLVASPDNTVLIFDFASGRVQKFS